MAISTINTPKVTIETQVGPITVELYPDNAPLTVANFLNYTEQGLFDGSSIFRIVNETNSEQVEDANARIQVVQTIYEMAEDQEYLQEEIAILKVYKL